MSMGADGKKTILGIDPGTNLLGYGVISIDEHGPSFTDMGVLDMRKEQDPYAKLGRIFEKISWLCDYYKPEAIACESPFYGKNAQVILKLGRAQGAGIVAAACKKIPVFEYAPREAKLAIVGNGSASKEQVNMMVQKTLKTDFEPKYLDATDALAIALCHYYNLTSPSGKATLGRSGAHRKSSSWEKFVADNPKRISR